MSLSEKFQITVPAKIEGGEDFVSFESQRKVCTDYAVKENHMPPGMELQTERSIPLCLAGTTDVSEDVTDKSMAKGFARKGMKGTDDQYDGEHVDLFYGEAVAENGDVGFMERNNYLDRA